MVSISVILPTARADHSIIGMSEWHIFYPTFEALLQQKFKDFEVIVVDALFPKRKEWLDKKWGFPVKYVPVHPNHRFWLDRKRWNVAGALNTGILHAEGELLVRIDDSSEFDPLFLQKFWDGYNQGYFPLAMHTRFRNGRQAYYDEQYRQAGYEFSREELDRKENLAKFYREGQPIRDTRWMTVEAKGGKMIAPAMWYYGYSSMSLEAALRVNGYDENFDESKSLEDMDMGNRLSMAGYKNMFLLDVTHSVIEHEHEPIPSEVIARDVKPIKCNYAVYLVNEKRNRWRANSEKLTEEDIEFIRIESLKPPCSPHPNFYDGDCKGELFNLWIDHQPIFDLRQERLQIGEKGNILNEKCLTEELQSTILNTPPHVGLNEGVGDSRIFRDLEYAFCLQHIKKGYDILDIGSSHPWFLLELKRRGCNIISVDIDSNAMRFQRQLGIDCREANIVNLPFRDDMFSIALCISTIEHVHGDEDIQGMREIRRVSPRAIIALPFGNSDNWIPHDVNRERQYDEDLLEKRILKGWKVHRRAQIAVWDPNIQKWLSEHCLYLLRDE